jgi:hypothetical protein
MGRFFETYGWLIYLALGILWAVVGLTQTFYPYELLKDDTQRVLGMSWTEFEDSDPEAAELVRYQYGGMGLLKTSWSFFVIVIAIIGLRTGGLWAWYTLWSVPILLVTNALYNAWFFGDVSEMLPWIPITTVSVLGLILPYRKFFPKEPQ